MNILIFGSTGFVGRNLVDGLLSRTNATITLAVRDVSYANKIYEEHASLSVISCSLGERESILEIIDDREIDVVIHLASSLIPSSNIDDFYHEIDDVVIPTYGLIDILSEKGIKFVFFSSGGTVYGNSNADKIHEHNELQPINHYGYAKLLIENYIQFSHNTNGLQYLILRPSNLYGKYQRLEARQGFISVAIGNVLSGRAIEIWGDGEIIRDYIDVEDAVLACVQLLRQGVCNQILNVGSGNGTSLNKIIHILDEYMNENVNVNYFPKREIDARKVVLDVTKLHDVIQLTPISIEEGIHRYLCNLGVIDE